MVEFTPHLGLIYHMVPMTRQDFWKSSDFEQMLELTSTWYNFDFGQLFMWIGNSDFEQMLELTSTSW